MTGPEQYRQSRKRLKETATSGPASPGEIPGSSGMHSCTPSLPSLPLAPVTHTPGAVLSIASPTQSQRNATSPCHRILDAAGGPSQTGEMSFYEEQILPRVTDRALLPAGL